MDEIWERALQTALNGETNCESVRTLTLDGAVKCFQVRFPPPGLLEKFHNLEHLSIANAGVSSLDNFPCLPKLQKLVLSDNRIAGGLEYLVQAGLDSLRDLDLSNNRLQYMEDLVPLAQLKLVSLDLYECPVTKIQDYRIRVFGLIRSLRYLDKMDVDGNERPESDDEEDDDSDEEDEEEEYDPGSGEVDGEGKSSKVSNGATFDRDGILDVDEGEESDADEEEREVLTVGDVSNGSVGHHSNGFRVSSSSRDVVDVDEEDEDDVDEDNLGEEIDEEDGEDEDVPEVHEIGDSDEIEGEDDDDEDDDEDDDVDEVDDEEEDVEPISTGRLTSTEGEIDGHDHGEEDENGDIGEEEDLSSENGDGEEDVDDEDGTDYMVQPIGDAEEDAGGSDFDEGDQDGESGEEEIDDVGVQPGEVYSHPSSSSSQVKRKRNEEDDVNEDDDEGVQNGDCPSASFEPKKKKN